MVRMMKSFRTRTIGRVFIMVALLGSTLSAQAQDVHQPGNSTTANATSHIPVTMTAAGLMERGMTQRQQGQLREAIGTFTQAGKIAGATGATEWQQRAAGELGVTLLQARHLAEAEPPLLIAYRSSQGRERARYAVYLGNLNQELKRHTSAENYYTEGLKLAGDDADTYWSVQLNRLRSLPEQDKAAHIQSLSAELNQAGASPGLARHHLNLGDQATQLGAPLRRIAYGHLDTARKLAERAQDPRLTVESFDALAQLYENQGRTADALALIAQGQALAERIPPAQNADLNIALEWRRGRLLKASGQNHAALAAYRRVVEQLDGVRQDIPVEYSDGRSSYRSLFEPIYTTYIDLLLSQLDRSAQEPATANLQQAVQALELIRQTELQDFLGDRCATETAQGSSSAANGTGAISRALPTGTAVLYPLILSDRLELLLVSNQGIFRRKVAVRSPELREEATEYAASLRRGLPDTRNSARRLNDWLLAPLAETLTTQRIERLIVVPDGAIRLIPLAALHDGQRYAIEKFAISMVTGMSMTNASEPARNGLSALVAGLSLPGPVVDKLEPLLAAQILAPDAGSGTSNRGLGGLAQHAELRAIRNLDVRIKDEGNTASPGRPSSAATTATAPATAATPAVTNSGLQALRDSLALPGVRDEIHSVSNVLRGQSLLDSEFTVGKFQDAVKSGDYRILHIASHGIFGGNAETSFIMAYDDVLNIHGLQALLKSEKFQKAPIELLSLSACQTAEGNDRAPLGISGAAIKARAKSVLGTLWPVEDNAAKLLMQYLYAELTQKQQSKAEALRQAQLRLLRQPATQHPFFWAPFVLIGNWL